MSTSSRHIKRSWLIVCIIIFSCELNAQPSNLDSLKAKLENADDTSKVLTFLEIGGVYIARGHYDSALSSYFNALKTAEQQSNNKFVIQSLSEIADLYALQRKLPLALDFVFKALKMAKDEKNDKAIFNLHDQLSLIYFNNQQYNESMTYGLLILKAIEGISDKEKKASAYMRMGDIYRALKKFDTALLFVNKALKELQVFGNKAYIAMCLNNIANIYQQQGNVKKTIETYRESLTYVGEKDLPELTGMIYFNLSVAYSSQGNIGQALLYANKSLEAAEIMNDWEQKKLIFMLLADLNASKKDYRQSYIFMLRYNNLSDSLNSTESQNQLLELRTRYENDKKEQQIQFLEKAAALNIKSRKFLIAGSILLALVIIIIARQYYLKRKAATIISVKNNELSKTLDELKSAQALLIQSEKMASLGELTAGIAHEIQNPLNFVNNFSEVNKELLVEMNDEIGKGNFDEVKKIAEDLTENEQKISDHGKRADAIVKGMLQHSRTSSGKKEPTDMNALAEEYLRLAYHGLRAKDKSFNALFKTELDPEIGKINVVTQDIGRVILNLINNAFYAVNEKKQASSTAFEPLVTISTKKLEGWIEIKVTDDGNGIPEQVIDKIFQPFFTTKPTGQGTGLGLSMSYDIIKAHGGVLKVETIEGEGTTFIISLPF